MGDTLYQLEHKDFNSHAHVERDDGIPKALADLMNFNSHAHVERDSSDVPSRSFQCNFNSHAHVERDQPVLTFHTAKGQHFNSHAHVERDLNRVFLPIILVYFNSHAHVERDLLTNIKQCAIIISTHTLTWSVTHWQSTDCIET